MNTQERIERIESDLAIVKKEIEKEVIEFEVGKWYKDTDDGYICCCQEHDNYDLIGYGFELIYGELIWCETVYVRKESAILATEQEVGEVVIKEAEKIGFKEGMMYIKCLEDGELWNLRDKDKKCYIFDFQLNEGLRLGAAFIFKDGKWAEIIDEPKKMTVSEISEKLGYKVEIIYEYPRKKE